MGLSLPPPFYSEASFGVQIFESIYYTTTPAPFHDLEKQYMAILEHSHAC